MTVTSVLSLPVRAGAEDAFQRAFRELAVFEQARRSGGFRGGRLLRPSAAGQPFLVVAEWESEEDYERWLASPRRAQLSAALEPFLAHEVAQGALYTCVEG